MAKSNRFVGAHYWYIFFVVKQYRWWYVLRRPPLVTALLCSLLLSSFYGVVGSIEREEPQNVSFSIAAGTSTDGWFDGPRSVGTYSYLGVPLYDSLQGAGARLPYKASWSSSLEWPLRLILDWELFVLVRIFTSSFAFLWLALATMRSYHPSISLRFEFVVGSLLLTPAFYFLRWEDWTDEWAMVAATAGLAMFLLRRQLFDGLSASKNGLFDTPWSTFLVAVCVSHLATGHVGVYPNAVFVLIPIVVMGIVISPYYRQALTRTFKMDRIRLALLSAPAIWVLVTVVWELQAESADQADWTAARLLRVGARFPDQAFLGLTRGVVPEIAERIASVLFINALLPVVALASPLLPPLDFVTRTVGVAPYGVFTGIVVLPVAILVARRMSSRRAYQQFIYVVTSAQLIAFIVMWLAQDDHLPTELIPSGVYKSFAMMLPLNVALVAVILGAVVRLPSSLALLLRFGLVTMILNLMIQILPGAMTWIDIDLPDQANTLATAAEATVLPLGSRSIILTDAADGEESSLPLGESYGLIVSGRPLLQSAAQIRDTNHMQSHSPTNGGYGFLSITDKSPQHVRETLEFFQIDTVLAPTSPGMRTALDPVFGNDSARNRPSSFGLMVAGQQVTGWKDMVTFSDVILDSPLSNESKCPVLEQRCPVVAETLRANPSETPKLLVCDDPCLWMYESGLIAVGQTLVIPVSFDPVLTVSDSTGRPLSTSNVAGFLGVAGPIDSPAQQLTLSVSPDRRMFALVAASYLSVLGVVALVAVSAYKRQRDELAINESSDERRRL